MSSESLDKAYATQIVNIEKASGKKIAEWATVLNKTGFTKHGELVNYLKEKPSFLGWILNKAPIQNNKIAS